METHPFRGTDASGLSAGFLIVFFLIAGVLIKIGLVWWAAVLMLGLCLLDMLQNESCAATKPRFPNKMSNL
jgi:hypothetical protein